MLHGAVPFLFGLPPGLLCFLRCRARHAPFLILGLGGRDELDHLSGPRSYARFDGYPFAVGQGEFAELDSDLPCRREIGIQGGEGPAAARNALDLRDLAGNLGSRRDDQLVEGIDRFNDMPAYRLAHPFDAYLLVERNFYGRSGGHDQGDRSIDRRFASGSANERRIRGRGTGEGR